MTKETLEEAAKKYSGIAYDRSDYEEMYYNQQGCDRYDAFINGAKWQQEQDNKELAMWKLAVEKQEARCTALRDVISDLQDKNKYSEKDLREAFIAGGNSQIEEDDDYGSRYLKYMEDWFQKFKKK